jgi:membrane AbrB-like protein
MAFFYHASASSLSPVRSAAPWALLGAAVLLVGGALDALGLPSAFLFGSLLAGLGFALAAPGRIELPPVTFTSAQAVLGIVIGAYLQASSLEALADDWLPVALVAASTLAISFAASQVVARLTGLDAVTAALGLVAGGASGIVGMADELGADARLVAFMQYARVLIVVLATPLIVVVAFPGGGDGSTVLPDEGPLLGTAQASPPGASCGCRSRRCWARCCSPAR